MKPILRQLHSPDLLDMEKGAPDDPATFLILVQAMIGPDEFVGEESFDFLVCTPDVIEKEVSSNGFLMPRHYLIVKHYDFAAIWDALEAICRSISGANWREVAEKVGRYGKWEFEDYQEKR